MTSTATTVENPAPPVRVPLEAVVAQVIGWGQPMRTAGNGLLLGRRMLDQVLAELAELGIPAPARVARVLEVGANMHKAPALDAYLAAQDTDDLDPGAIAKAARDHAAALGASEGETACEITAHLLQRAVDALADDLDGIVDELRTRWWVEPAQVVADAAAAGVHVGMTADEAIESDEHVRHWRALRPAVRRLDQVARVYFHALLLCGFPLGVDEQIPQGRDAWLDRSVAGPAGLLAPTARPRPAVVASYGPRRDFGAGRSRDIRSAVAKAMQRGLDGR